MGKQDDIRKLAAYFERQMESHFREQEGVAQEAASHGERLGELEDRMAVLERVARANGWTVE